jgi:hypothetical protein
MIGPRRLGFRSGQSSYNAVLGAMYLAVIVVIMGAVITNGIIPAFSSSSSSGAGNGGDVVATSTPTESGSKTPQSTPQHTQSSSQATSAISLTENQLEQQYKDTITNNSDMTIVSAERRGDTFYVIYISQNISRQILKNETAGLLGAYSASTEYWDVERLHVTILNENRNSIATYHAETRWMKQVQRGEMSRNQAVNQALDTINETSPRTDGTPSM